ncbi:MAG: hypothetical protein NTW86_10520 [Candidatus Sumerlaeota bacterium]|nr:hypothetical protein [Candidatus Sumerlaeota bacterium]
MGSGAEMANHDESVAALNEALRLKFHSFPRYVLTSNPYATPADLPLVEALERMAATDLEQAREITARIEALKGIPVPGAPSPVFSEIGYLSIPALSRRCMASKREEAERLRGRLADLAESAKSDPATAEALALMGRVIQTDLEQADALQSAFEAIAAKT